jgi:hypothetical protein
MHHKSVAEGRLPSIETGGRIMKRLVGALMLALPALLLVVGTASALEEEGHYETPLYGGYYDTNEEDDWFYDAYEPDYADAWGQSDWFYDEGMYSGNYDDEWGAEDWFYDTYDDPGDEGVFDV